MPLRVNRRTRKNPKANRDALLCSVLLRMLLDRAGARNAYTRAELLE